MSAMGRLYCSVQEDLFNGVSRSEIAKMLRDRYGFGEKSAVEFIRQVEKDLEEFDNAPC